MSSVRIARTRLSVVTEPRDIQEITAEVADWTKRQRIFGRPPYPLYPVHLRVAYTTAT
jgi:hypothetical protein